MANVLNPAKACSVNPLKMSAPIGAALAFMGLQHCLPTLHGSQGCTSFGLVLFVRHFREMIPMQTTAMSEVTTILGGMDNIEQTIVNIWKRNQPSILGIASTGLTETKGDDVDAYLKLIAQKHPELADMHILYVSTPDYVGAFQDGWSKALLKIVQHFSQPVTIRHTRRVNVLAGSHLTPGDLQEIRDIVELFGLEAVLIPDISGSLDGHIPEDFTPTTLGGTTLEQLQTMGAARYTLAIGEQVRTAAQALETQCGVPYRVFDRLTGLAASDALVQCLSELSGLPVPLKLRRQRSQCQDAMLDAHFYTGGKMVAIGAEPDMLYGYGQFLLEMGCDLRAVTTTHSPVLAQLPIAQVLIGDLEDLETMAHGCDLLLTHSHGRQLAERLQLPFMRIGIPTFDRIGAAHKVSVGYRGTRDLAFELANTFLAHSHEAAPDQWYPALASEAAAAPGCNNCAPAGSCHSASDMPLESTVHFS